MSTVGEDESLPANTFKILVATDIHLGFAEKNPIRGQDTFVTFEEILQIAAKSDVDFLLLGGDLFHESKPSPYCINKCLELLRRYCLGNKAITIEFLSDQSRNFQFQMVPIVNYEDPNLNVAIPVFSIHGNHDDPTGHKQTSALDIIASTGLINYFGRWNDLSAVEIHPILLKKGETKIALYGLSHIKDERLGRLFRDNKVHMKQPNGNDWFSILVLHQNRAARGVKNFIPETSLPEFLDLVIWGHEHDCHTRTVEINSVHIYQPGSSVATSLATGESEKKHVGLLYVNKDRFMLKPIPLSTVRPFLIEEFVLTNPNSDDYCLEKPADQAIEQVKEKINEMIQEAASEYQGEGKPPLPLIRLKVFYHEERQQFNAVRVGMQFCGRVANPDDMIKINSTVAKERKKNCSLNMDEDDYEKFVDVAEWATCVEDVVMKYFEKKGHQEAMSILSPEGLTEAVSRFVKQGDNDALSVIMDKQYSLTVKQLITLDPDLDKIEDAIDSLRVQRQENAAPNETIQRTNGEANAITVSDDEVPVSTRKPNNRARRGGARPSTSTASSHQQNDECIVLSDEDEFAASSSTTSRGRNPTSSRGSRASRARGTPRAKRGKKDGTYGALEAFLE